MPSRHSRSPLSRQRLLRHTEHMAGFAVCEKDDETDRAADFVFLRQDAAGEFQFAAIGSVGWYYFITRTTAVWCRVRPAFSPRATSE